MPRRTTAVRTAFVALAMVVGLAACGGDDTTSPAGQGTPAGHASGPLAFRAEVLGGGQLDGSSLAGRAVMLWFWAPT